MTLDEFRIEMVLYWHSVDEEAKLHKNPYIVIERLHTLYGKFDDVERSMADEVFGEWVLSEDEGMRSIAQHFIYEYRIQSAVPALHKLAKRLVSGRGPGAPFELELVDRIIAGLTSNSEIY